MIPAVTTRAVPTRSAAPKRSRPRRKRRLSPLTVYLSWAGVLVIVLTWLLYARVGLPRLPAYLVAVNLVTALAYGFDKMAARRKWKRVPERALHVMAVAGGTPAAFAAQRYWRHKTVKASFQLRFWLILSIQGVIVALWLIHWLLT